MVNGLQAIIGIGTEVFGTSDYSRVPQYDDIDDWNDIPAGRPS